MIPDALFAIGSRKKGIHRKDAGFCNIGAKLMIDSRKARCRIFWNGL
jgi:hypothetical protein